MQRLILVVDDTAYAREALALALMSIPGVDVRTAGSMLEAMKILESEDSVHALCTDLNMPFGGVKSSGIGREGIPGTPRD